MARDIYPVWYIEEGPDVERLYEKGLIATRERERLFELLSGNPAPFLYKGRGQGYVIFLSDDLGLEWMSLDEVLRGVERWLHE